MTILISLVIFNLLPLMVLCGALAYYLVPTPELYDFPVCMAWHEESVFAGPKEIWVDIDVTEFDLGFAEISDEEILSLITPPSEELELTMEGINPEVEVETPFCQLSIDEWLDNDDSLLFVLAATELHA